MYPRRDLIELEQAKARLRWRIAGRRRENAALARRVIRPLGWIDFAWGLWRELSGGARLASMPVALALARGLVPRDGWLRRWLRWLPLAWSVWCGLRSVLGPPRAGESKDENAGPAGPGQTAPAEDAPGREGPAFAAPPPASNCGSPA